MPSNNVPYFCGSIFFNLLLQARKPRSKARNKQHGGSDGLADQDVMKGLVFVITGDELSKTGDFSKNTSEYKTCKINNSTYIPFEEKSTVSAFIDCFNKKDPDLPLRMSELITKYFSESKYEWLVKAIIETLHDDEGISNDTVFLINQERKLAVSDLMTVETVELEIFLLSVLEYILQYRTDNSLGVDTFHTWFNRKSKGAQWKFVRDDIGQSITHNIQIIRYQNDLGAEDSTGEIYDFSDKTGLITNLNGKAPDLSLFNDGNLLLLDRALFEDEDNNTPFSKYLNEASQYFSTKKTLLYAEQPRPFYDLYVCNDIRYRKFRVVGARDTKEEKIIKNATVELLDAESKYVIIQGTGGIGKSMLLTHLFLDSVNKVEESGKLPLLLFLKDYKDNTDGIVDFIWKSVLEFDNTISQREIVEMLSRGQLIILLDGLDEIQSSLIDNFNKDLEAFIKSYPGNNIIMTSRPVYHFLSYSKFYVFDIQELNKEQAIEMIKKLEFWDIEGKENFIQALSTKLYYSHRQFASNPLLLTIMLMTYSSFGEVPAKMHVFYSKAYETMARLHDASKGSFKRPLHTNLTPEEFSKYFSQFCARTYTDEILEFDVRLFTSYMNKVMKSAFTEHRNIPARDFLKDLTDNLCIMYHEGDKYYFIHRSFQEYFAALYFSTEYDSKLTKVGKFFEERKNRSYTDRTFDMLYDMIPEKIERFIFLPYLDKLLADCANKGQDEEYWEFLEIMYPCIYYEFGETGESYFNTPQSFIYGRITRIKALEEAFNLDNYNWIGINDNLPCISWVRVFSEFTEDECFDKYPIASLIDEELIEDTTIIDKSDLPIKYEDYFGKPESVGETYEIEIYNLRKYPQRYTKLISRMEDSDFPLMCEFQNIKQYYEELNNRTLQEESDDLFDD